MKLQLASRQYGWMQNPHMHAINVAMMAREVLRNHKFMDKTYDIIQLKLDVIILHAYHTTRLICFVLMCIEHRLVKVCCCLQQSYYRDYRPP